MTAYSYDFLVIGSGVAGLTFALKAARHGQVALVTKKELAESNTNYAQGGIAAVLADDDSFALHREDTMKAGADLCHRDAVDIMVESGPQMIEELIAFGVAFSRGDDALLDLGREGGHSRRRIAHARDLTGAEIERALIGAVKQNSAITIYENHLAIDLITHAKLSQGAIEPGGGGDQVVGAYVIDTITGRIASFAARATLLATGGVGKVYLYTSNPDIASGDGIAMAYRAGASIANMEFMQFHPTCLYHPLAKSFLVSEAVRGEGAILKLSDGSTFMENYHEMGSLAPRDVVARAIDREIKKRGDDFVYLDTTLIDADYFKERFPTIYDTCRRHGYDPGAEMIPVVPAAHYMCGGVATDLSGRTGITGLFAAGECAHTGVHGANRLASNSLLEAVVFADRACQAAVDYVTSEKPSLEKLPPWNPGKAAAEDEQVVISHMWDELRRTMWNYVGIARTDKRLLRARRRIVNLLKEIDEYYWRVIITPDLIELRNLAICGQLIVECALRRKESRGLHYTLDYPERDDERCRVDTVVSRKELEG